MKVILAVILFVVRLVVQTVFLALGQIWANKTRSVLTCLGIIFGVAAVIAVVGLLGGMRGFVLKEFETIGAKKMWVWGDVPESKESVMSWTDVKMTLSEAKLILEKAPSIDTLTPMTEMGMGVSYKGKVLQGIRVKGVWSEWHEIEDRQVIYGRPFSRIDEEEARQVALVNLTAIEKLGLSTDPSGEYILLDNRRFLVIGLVETKDFSFADGGQGAEAEIIIPYATVKSMNPYSGVYFTMQMKDPDAADDAEAEVRFILRNRRGLGPEDEDTFGIQVLQSVIEQFNMIASVATIGGFFVAAISLFVGGIGIMNIMLVSVSERTREIGLRKAVGAKPPTVLLQFLVEAIVLCLVGGLIGLGIGQGVIMGFRAGLDWMSEAGVPVWIVVGVLAVTGATGVIFGMFPAIKAARLNPIDALRHE